MALINDFKNIAKRMHDLQLRAAPNMTATEVLKALEVLKGFQEPAKSLEPLIEQYAKLARSIGAKLNEQD